MQDLIKADEANNTNDCIRVCVKSYSVLTIFFIMLLDVANYVHLMVLNENLWVKFLSHSRAVPHEGNTSLRSQGSYSYATLG